MTQISLVCLGPNSALYALDETFNVIVEGEILDQATGKRLTRFDVLADFPIQVNALDYARPLNILSTQ